MAKSKKKIYQKTIRPIDAIQGIDAGLSSAVGGVDVLADTRLVKIYVLTKDFVRRAPESLKVGASRVKRSSQRMLGEAASKLPKITVSQHDVPHRVKSVVASTSLALMMVLMLFNLGIHNVARAFDTLNQSDWSGGQGSSPVNQFSDKDNNVVTNTSGQISLSGGSFGWCSTAECNSGWTKRKRLAVRGNVNANVSMSYAVIVLQVNYDSDMKPDFSDLRFVDRNNAADIPYFIIRKIDGVSATVYIKSPLSNGGFNSHHYMYYGNSAATSLSSKSSVFDAHDQFDEGILNGSDFWVSSGTIVDGAARIDDLSTGFGLSHSFDRSRTRVYEFDEKIHLSGSLTCSDDIEVGGFYVGYGSSNSSLSFYHPGECDDQGQYWGANYAHSDSIGQQTNNAFQPRFRDEQYVRFRVTAYKDGGQRFEYSLDGGSTYSVFSWIGDSNDTFDTYLGVGNGRAPATYRNVVAYQSLVGKTTEISLIPEVEESVGGRMGTLVSVEYDLGSDRTAFGAINALTSGSGDVGFYVSSSSTPGDTLSLIDMYIGCDFIQNGESVADSNCVSPGDRYIKYAVYIADTAANDLTIDDINLEYLIDNTGPSVVSNLQTKRPSNDAQVTTGWVNERPKFTWDASSDGSEGSGVAGYCLYFGTDESADLTTTAGMLSVLSGSPVNTGGLCQYAISGTSVDISQLVDAQYFGSGATYFLKVRPFDYSGNLAASSAVATVGYDTDAPVGNTVVSGPNGTVNNPIVSINWITTPPAMAIDDGGSGFAGIRYCVFNFNTAADGCGIFVTGQPGDGYGWYGASGNAGSMYGTSDLIPFSQAGFTISNNALTRLTDEGVNGVVVVAVDNAGNLGAMGSFGQIYYSATQQPPSMPQNLAVTPTSSTDNNFSFTWDEPTTFTGPTGQINYCWTVNVSIAADGSNCNWTGQGITQLAQGAYATRQGVNTLYLMAKDQSQNFSNANAASVNFTATTAAPGAPQNLELSDVSIRATSSWKIALSWSAPQLSGSGVAGYKIYRSTNSVNFTEVGTTSSTNLSFIDSGLSQTDYYYYVKACDNADSCSVASNTETKYPNGRYTTPARLTDDTDQPKIRDIGTRKATIYWFTDRASDSKIAYGTAPGQYFPEEIGNSTQDSSHVVNLTSLEPGKTYYYVARWTDEDGNTGISQERAFTTLPAPTVREVSASNLTISSGVVNFTTENAYKANVYYGTSDAFGGVKSINTSTTSSGYSLSLNDLQDGQKYFYKISTVDADGYEYQGDIYSFTTPARPRITNLRFETVEGEPSSTQKIVWTTNVATTSEVAYGLVDAEQVEAVSSTLVTEHEMIIRGLADNADYQLVARSRDAAGNLAVSDRQFFQTAEDTRSPKITEFKVETDIRGTGGEARGQIIVSWRTDEPATSQVAFAKGRTTELSNRSSQDTRLTTEHVVVVSDLTTSSIYQVQAVSADKAGNEAFSDTQTAIIGRGTENIFSIIFNALQAIFGFGDTSL